jgi:hypothetical protein
MRKTLIALAAFIGAAIAFSCARQASTHDVCRDNPGDPKCGIACITDNDCGPALFCTDDKKCNAECQVGSNSCGDGFFCATHGRCQANDTADLAVRPCVGLECQQKVCAGGGTTSVSGIVRDPAGKVPLYNVVVYVPNAPVAAIPSGASCDKCGSTLSGSPIATTLTDTAGKFTLPNVPVGDNIPLVIQIGKWRKQIVLPKVAECVDTPITDATITRLPSKHSATEDIPLIALTTGGADALECLLRKVGIDDSEFTLPAGSGRVHLYAGGGGSNQYTSALNNGANIPPANSFWESLDNLKKYDIVVLSCEGDQGEHNFPGTNGPNYGKTTTARQAMVDYAALGGRIFASHWHNYWLEAAPAMSMWPTVATFNHQSDLNGITADIDMSFPKGMAMAEWLVNVGGSTTLGKVMINAAQHTVDGTNKPPAQRWIYLNSPNSTQYLSFNTPIDKPEDQQCGRVVFSDIHVSSGDDPGDDFPSGCDTTDLSAQEKVLEFMLFDLSSCVQADDKPPINPPIDVL